MTEAPKFVGTS